MANEYLISIIIPAYNSERFLDRAVQSVLPQLDGTVELVLVNDGSNDSTPKICDNYASNNQDVRVVHKTNGGLSSARNAGINVARGEYLLFLDSDDYIELNTCFEVTSVIKQFHPDCIDFGWRYISNGEPMVPAFHKLPKKQLLDKVVIYDLILPPLLNIKNDPDYFIFDFSCTKVFRRDIVQINNIEFDENRHVWEDRPFVVQYLKYSENYFSIEQCFYNYVDTPDSLSRRFSLEFFRIIIENFNLYRELFGDKYDFDTQYVNNYWAKAIENMIYLSLAQTENIEMIRTNILDTLKNEQVIHWFSKRTSDTKAEKTAGKYIINGELENALCIYKKQLKNKKAKETRDLMKSRIKQMLKFWER